MSEQEAQQKGLRLIPVWLPIVTSLVTIFCSAGAASATYAWRMTDAERRLGAIETDRIEKVRDYQQFKADIRADVAEMKADIRWIRTTLEKR